MQILLYQDQLDQLEQTLLFLVLLDLPDPLELGLLNPVPLVLPVLQELIL